jgi:hypothetical protein
VGARVRVDRAGAGLTLYLTKDHAKAFDKESAIQLSDTSEGANTYSRCLNSYVDVVGRVVKIESNSYTLAQIKSIFNPSAGNFCYQSDEELPSDHREEVDTVSGHPGEPP